MDLTDMAKIQLMMKRQYISKFHALMDACNKIFQMIILGMSLTKIKRYNICLSTVKL